MLTLTGKWNHNSYLILPTQAQFDGAPPIPANAVKWAKGELDIPPGSVNKGRLIFQPGAELVVSFSLETIDGQVLFKAQGVGEAGPLQGVVYHLMGWATPADNGDISEVSGAILFVKGADANSAAGSGGQAPGTVGYFRLSK